MAQIYDGSWFSQLVAINKSYSDDVDWIQSRMKIDNEERERFLDNEIENPLFSYTSNTESKMNEPLSCKSLELLLQEIVKTEENEVVKKLYEAKITNQINRVGMFNASMNSDDKEFYRLSCQLHGKPKNKYFAYIAKKVMNLTKLAGPEHLVEVRHLKKIFSKINVTGVDISSDILPPLVHDDVFIQTPDEVVAVFRETLDEYEITGWKIQVDQENKRVNFAVSTPQRIIYIPGKEKLLARPKLLTKLQVKALATHEIGVHVRRSYCGAGSNLHLLQIGLDSYLQGEEGVASYVQQQCEGATEFYGFDRYMAASLAVGMDGTPRDFRSVFSVMVDYYTILATVSKEHQKLVPLRSAWDVCVRIFRGTTGQSTGFIYTRDIVYMEGNIEIWHLLSEKPHIYPKLFLGKYNPLLPRHIKALKALEILTDW